MEIVSSEYKEQLEKMALSPKSKIIVDGIEYLGDVIKTSPKISHSNSTFIGGFPAKTVSFDIYNLNNDLDFENKEITVFKGLVINDSIEWVKQGVFIPQATNIMNDITTKTLKITNAQDKTQLFENRYVSSLDWTNDKKHSGLEIIQEICTKKGIVLEKTDFAWANYLFKQPNFNENATDREVISRIAEIGGEIAFLSSNGGLVIKGQNITGDTIKRARYEDLSKENTYTVNTVILGKDGIDDDIVYPENINEDRVEFKILDNPFVDLYREEMISIVADYIIGKSYTPFNLIGFVDGFLYELNDVVEIIDKNNNVFNAVILDYLNTSRIKSTIKAEAIEKTITDYNLAGSSQNELRKVKLAVDHNNQVIQALASEVAESTDKVAKMEITVNEMVSDISHKYDFLESDEGTNQLDFDNSLEYQPVSFNIQGNTEKILYVYSSDNLYPSNNLYPRGLVEGSCE